MIKNLKPGQLFTFNSHVYRVKRMPSWALTVCGECRSCGYPICYNYKRYYNYNIPSRNAKGYFLCQNSLPKNCHPVRIK